jgi:hypothetical protein
MLLLLAALSAVIAATAYAAYIPSSIVAGSFYDLSMPFNGFGLTSANATLVTTINTTNPYYFSFNSSVNGYGLSCAAPVTSGNYSKYVCFADNVPIHHNTILNLYGILGNATNLLSENFSSLAVTPIRNYSIDTQLLLNGNVTLNQSVVTKTVGISDYSGQQTTKLYNLTLNCSDLPVIYATHNLSVKIVPDICYTDNASVAAGAQPSSSEEYSIYFNMSNSRLQYRGSVSDVNVTVSYPAFAPGEIPSGYEGFLAFSISATSSGKPLPSFSYLYSTYRCSLPIGPLSAIAYSGSGAAKVAVSTVKVPNGCQADEGYWSGPTIVVLQQIPVPGLHLTTTIITTTVPTTTVAPSNNGGGVVRTTYTTTSTTSSTIPSTVPPTTITQNTAPQPESQQQKTRNTAAVTVAITSASTAAIGTVRRSGRK